MSYKSPEPQPDLGARLNDISPVLSVPNIDILTPSSNGPAPDCKFNSKGSQITRFRDTNEK